MSHADVLQNRSGSVIRIVPPNDGETSIETRPGSCLDTIRYSSDSGIAITVSRRRSMRVNMLRAMARAGVRLLTKPRTPPRSEEHTSELQSHCNIVCRLLLA